MKRDALFLAAVVLLGLNLRPLLAGVGPLLDGIQADTGLDHVGASLLTTLPVVAMGLGALVSATLARAFGERAGILGGLLLMAGACAWRGYRPDAGTLIVSALLAGAGIAFVQALLPAVIKRRTGAASARVVGLYGTAIMAGTALGAALSPWIAAQVGWPPALAVWALPALFTGGLWWWLDHGEERTPGTAVPARRLRPWRRPRAWLLMLFFGLGTSAYTLVLAWLPPYYTAFGWSAEASGMLLAGLTLCEVAIGLVVAALLDRWPDRRPLLLAMLACVLAGLGCLLLDPQRLWIAICLLLGFGIGALFPLTLIVAQDHLDDPRQTGELLGFVQGGGYLIAASAPLLAGLLRQYTHDLRLAWLAMAAITLLLAALATRFAPDSGRLRAESALASGAAT